jgi:hypothetical protein
LRYEGGERGTNVPHGLHTIADAIVADGWHTTVAALVESTGIFLAQSFYRDFEDKCRLLVPLLAAAGRGRGPPGYGNNDIKQKCISVSSCSDDSLFWTQY